MFAVVKGVRARHAMRDEVDQDRGREGTGGGTDPDGGAAPPGGDGPHACLLTFASLPSTPRWARALARDTLRGWALDSVTDTVELLLSELVTNAVKAGAPDAVVRVAIRATTDRIRIEVADGCAGSPHVDDPDPDTEGGRGLLLVSTISAEWGTYPAPLRPGKADGKVVWCEIPTAGAPS
jgi:anti-sigma regulatory factor (Ser/Thr protein kinase)